MSWLVYALLSAFFAAVTAILAKIGIKDIDSNLATAIRTIVILAFAWGIVFFQGTSFLAMLNYLITPEKRTPKAIAVITAKEASVLRKRSKATFFLPSK